MEERITEIAELLKYKTTLHREVAKAAVTAFEVMYAVAEDLAKKINEKAGTADDAPKVKFKNMGEFEFHLDFSGDLLIFTLNPQIMALMEGHPGYMNSYMLEDTSRSYFGHVMIYNFLSDSVSGNRLGDIGYLVGRLMVNKDLNFYIEGMREMALRYPDLSKNKITTEALADIVAESMVSAIENDIIAPFFQDIQVVELGQKLANPNVGGGQKVGFQSNSEREKS